MRVGDFVINVPERDESSKAEEGLPVFSYQRMDFE